MQPIIGIVPSIDEKNEQYFTNIANVRAIKQAGGLPIVLPYTETAEMIKKYATMIDGLYLAGGNDIDPNYYDEVPHPKLGEVNPTRDAFEWEMLKHICHDNKPVLGVCKGMQMINVFFSGSLYQDMTSQITETLIQHDQKSPLKHPIHVVELIKETKLYQMIQQDTIKVNSHHHQAIRHVGDGLIVSGQTSDGIVEAIESIRHSFVVGIQWHPEELLKTNEPTAIKIYEMFISQCKSSAS